MIKRLDLYAKLVRLDKPIGILLLLWPTLWALFAAAKGWPDTQVLIIFILGTVLMRSAGCAMNDFFDRDVDLHVKRTKERVLTSGLIKPIEAIYVAVFLALLSLLLILPLNGLTWILACFAAVLAVTYPLMKRFFAIPQAYLGIAFGFGIPMGFAAITAEIPLAAWLMLAANICWSIAYDTEYAMVDRDDDIKLGLKTSAITFGRYDILWIAIFYVCTILLLWSTGFLLGYGIAYWISLIIASCIAGMHLYWIRDRDRQACFKAFLHNTWFGFAVFIGIFIETVFR